MEEWEEIYKKESRAVYLYLLKNTRDPHLAEDLTSECFIQAMEKAKDFAGHSSLRTWLISIGKNLLRDHLRKEKKILWREDFSEVKQGKNPEDTWIDSIVAREFAERIEELPPPYATLLRLRLLEHKSYREIAKTMGRSVNWVAVTYHRGRKKLQRIIASEKED